MMKRQEKILEKVKGTKNIPNIKSVKRRILIPKVRNKDGEEEKTRQGIANVFAKFYEDLYKCRRRTRRRRQVLMHRPKKNMDSSQNETIPEFTTEEIQAAINRLKKGKAKDSSGVRAEQLKICSEDMKEKIRIIFNDIARQDDFTPNSWRKIRIQVIHKKGDREDTGNYRPICGLPSLYKLFATVLYARLAPSLHKLQPPDQAGFRPNHRCEDHLTVFRILEQRRREWGVPLYISTTDFTKAFDSIKHSAIWNSLRFYGIKPAYVKLLQKLYKQQEGTVLTDKESEVFAIKKRPSKVTHCHLFFNTVLQYSLENNLTKWQENRKGIRLSDKAEDSGDAPSDAPSDAYLSLHFGLRPRVQSRSFSTTLTVTHHATHTPVPCQLTMRNDYFCTRMGSFTHDDNPKIKTAVVTHSNRFTSSLESTKL